MPKVKPSDDSMDPRVFGRNVRDLRRVRGWSIDALAKRAEVASYTVHRIEHGFPSTLQRRTRIAYALDTVVERLTRSDSPATQDVALHPTENDHWIGLIDWRPIIPEDNDEAIQSAEERSRLGSLGFVTQFVKLLGCRLPNGKLVAGILELHGDLPASRYLGGEIFAFALRGDSFLHHDGNSHLLREGCAVTFDCSKPFLFAPTKPVARGTTPPLVLYVRLEETEPISFRRPKRGRKVEGPFQKWVDPDGKVPDPVLQIKKGGDRSHSNDELP